jgi:hypothetical protein
MNFGIAEILVFLILIVAVFVIVRLISRRGGNNGD